jgi:hypothetical protein
MGPKLKKGGHDGDKIRDDLPTLRYTPGEKSLQSITFIVEAAERFRTYAVENINSYMGDVFELNRHHDFGALPAWQGPNVGFLMPQQQLELDELKKRRERLSKAMDEYLEAYRPTWEMLWHNTSESLRAAVTENQVEYDAANAVKDPLWLWDKITAIINGVTAALPPQGEEPGSALILEQQQVDQLFFSLVQDQLETVEKFAKRFRVMQRVRTLAGINIGTARRQGMDFLQKIDNARFAQLKLELYNDLKISNNDRYPASVAAAYRQASEFKVLKNRGELMAIKPAAVYAATNMAHDTHRDDKETEPDELGDEEAEEDTNDSESDGEPEDAPSGDRERTQAKARDEEEPQDASSRRDKCDLCAKRGHKARKCPYAEQFRSVMKTIAFTSYDDNSSASDEDEGY